MKVYDPTPSATPSRMPSAIVAVLALMCRPRIATDVFLAREHTRSLGAILGPHHRTRSDLHHLVMSSAIPVPVMEKVSVMRITIACAQNSMWHTACLSEVEWAPSRVRNAP